MEAGAVPTPLPKPSRDERDDVVILRDTPWALYEAILATRGEKRVPRLQYASGRLELMSPGRSHARIHTLFGRLVEAYADECDIALDGYGSRTLEDEAVAGGVRTPAGGRVGVAVVARRAERAPHSAERRPCLRQRSRRWLRSTPA